MSEAIIVALTGVGIAFISMIRDVATLYIRARFKWRNGDGKQDPPTAPAH